MTLTSAALLAVFALAQHAGAPGETEAVVTNRTVTASTRLVQVLPDGRSAAGVGLRAWLLASVNKPGPHGGSQELVHRMSALAGPDGQVSFTDVPVIEGAQYHFEAPYQGVPYRSGAFEAGQSAPPELRVFPVSAERPIGDTVRFRMQVVVEVTEAYLSVTQHVRVENTGTITWDADATRGLRLPTLSYVALDRVAAWGIFPEGRPVGSPRPSTGLGRVVGESGALVFRGPVAPGNGLFFQFRYDVPYGRESARVGLVSDIPIEELVVTVREPVGHDVTSELERRHRAFPREEEGVGQVDALVEGRVAAGELVTLRLGRLPAESAVPRRLTAGVSIVLLLCAIPWVAGLRRRLSGGTAANAGVRPSRGGDDGLRTDPQPGVAPQA